MENSKNMLLYMNMSLSLISFARYAVCSLFSWKASAFSVFHFTWAVFKLRFEIKLWQCNILLYMGNLSEQQWLEWGVIVCIFFLFSFFFFPKWVHSGTFQVLLVLDPKTFYQLIGTALFCQLFYLSLNWLMPKFYTDVTLFDCQVTLSEVRSATNINRNRSSWN